MRRLSPLIVLGALLLGACSEAATGDSGTATPTAEAADAGAVTVERGQEVAQQMGCASCHTPNGNQSVGPTWLGLFGAERPISGGSSVTADEAYLRESILDPNAKVAEGYSPGIMPQNFSERLSASEIDSVLEYIKTLQ